MLPYINIFGRQIATYGFIIVLGIIIGTMIAVFYFSKFNKVKRDDVFYSILYGIIGIVVGAKLLYILTNIPLLVQSENILDTLLQMLSGGFVFYGGLIGGILGIFIYAKQFKIEFKSLLLTIVPVIPLVHAIGRIGCLCAGCCYGMEYHGFGAITFHNSLIAPNEIPLFPTQILESICNLLIFVILTITYKKYIGTYKTVGLYCMLYSIIRFILEFFRGDLIRGIYLGISTSQWISIALLILGLVIFIKGEKNNENGVRNKSVRNR